jgi:hypothetical protein
LALVGLKRIAIEFSGQCFHGSYVLMRARKDCIRQFSGFHKPVVAQYVTTQMKHLVLCGLPCALSFIFRG